MAVYYNGVWGTVCDYYWDQRDAIVVCRQLGYPYGKVEYFRDSHFGVGAGRMVDVLTLEWDQVWMTNVRCTGTEARLSDCPHNGWGVTPSLCDDHRDDAGVRCTDGMSLYQGI